MKKQLLLLFAALLPLLASAQTKVEIDGIWYNLYAAHKGAQVVSNPDGKTKYTGSIILPATVAYEGVEYNVTEICEAFFGCSSLTSITIPASVTWLNDYTFYNCSSLTSITLPEGITSIGMGVFSSCSSLTSVIIPESVEWIGSCAFDDCHRLTSITIPSKVVSIDLNAFRGCVGLESITCKAVTPPNFHLESSYGYDFSDINKSIPLYVPAEAVEAYKTAPYWSEFINIIGMKTSAKCATPTISYFNGKVMLTCDTENAKVITAIDKGDAEVSEELEFDLISTYTITAYATKENYEDSDVATLTICWIPCAEEHESEKDGILTIPAKPVLISTQGGTITLSGLAGGTEAAAYDLAGRELATARATDGTAELTTGLEVGSTAIVKIGNNNIKIVIR